MKNKNNLLLDYDLQLFAEDNQKDETQEASENNVDNDAEENNSQKEKTFTQEQVNRIMSKEKKQGRNSILKELGINPNDEKALDNLKTLIGSQKTNEEKALEKEIANQTALQEAERRVMIAESKVEAVKEGIKSQFVDDAITLAIAKSENGEVDIKSVLAEFKVKYPMWFEDSNSDENPKAGQKGTGSSIGADKKNNNSQGIGKRLAAQRKTRNDVKKTYWSN